MIPERHDGARRGGRIGCLIGGALFVLVGVPLLALGMILGGGRCEAAEAPCRGPLPEWVWVAVIVVGAGAAGVSALVRYVVDRLDAD